MNDDPLCNICSGPTVPLVAKEQMLGYGDEFTYRQCQSCGHTHLPNPPSAIQMHKYYDKREYYSFRAKKPLFKSPAFKAFKDAKLTDKELYILDYGCGSGYFVQELEDAGYKNVAGYDPYLPDELCSRRINNILIPYKWDVITLHHVFEHLPDPVITLRSLAGKLNPGGRMLLRFPVIDSYAFEKYHTNWVQLDAPRHLNLFTRKSFRNVVRLAGLSLIYMEDDSTHFQFTGSERYAAGKSLKGNTFIKRLLSPGTYLYMNKAKQLNSQNRGDQVSTLTYKP